MNSSVIAIECRPRVWIFEFIHEPIYNPAMDADIEKLRRELMHLEAQFAAAALVAKKALARADELQHRSQELFETAEKLRRRLEALSEPHAGDHSP